MERSFRIDLLRFLGLVLIILAHVNAPNSVVQLRSFDVPLMVLVSALCFKASKLSTGAYLWKRFKRLYIPTLVFLFLYFTLIWFADCLGIRIPYSKMQVLGTFLLLEKPSIGYVWIIRVFIMMALIAPFVNEFINRLKPKIVALTIIVVYGAIEWLVWVDYVSNEAIHFLINEIIVYILGYGIILAIGLSLRKLGRRTQNLIFIISTIVVVALALIMYHLGHVLPISSEYKYPPHGIYLIYGISVSLLIYHISIKISFGNVVGNFITYVSQHSLWIYLWHIPFVVFMNFLSVLDGVWYLKWGVAFICACSTTYIQVLCIEKICKRSPNWTWLGYLKN